MRPALEQWPLTRLRHPNDPHREKIDPERVAQLAADIAAVGLINPIQIRGPMADGTAEVIAGDRRVYAHELLGWDSLACFVYPATTDPLTIRASENLHHEALSPVEEARIAARYHALGMPLAHVAAKMGHGEQWVRERMAILDYPPDVLAAIADGSLTLSVAAQLREVDHEGYRTSLIGEAVRTGASARTAAVWIAHWRADGARLAANHEAIEVIARERENFRVVIACDACGRDAPIETTRSMRFDPECFAEMQRAIREANASPA